MVPQEFIVPEPPMPPPVLLAVIAVATATPAAPGRTRQPATPRPAAASPQTPLACSAMPCRHSSDQPIDPCVGGWSTPCTETPGGGSTRGLSGCLAQELEAWESVRSAVHARLLDAARTYDEDPVDGAPPVGASLVAAKAAWEAHRDAQCTYEWSEYAGGTMRGIVAVSCRLQLTADRCAYLVAHGSHQKHFERSEKPWTDKSLR